MFRRACVSGDRRRCVDPIVIGLAVIGLLEGCASTDRPSSSEWGTQWNQKRALVPTADEMVEGGRVYCDELLAKLRMQLDDLRPTPSESIDPALDSWSAHLRTLAFDCPADRARINAELATIDALADEIEAVLREP
jgi:hypothetical protein